MMEFRKVSGLKRLHASGRNEVPANLISANNAFARGARVPIGCTNDVCPGGPLAS